MQLIAVVGSLTAGEIARSAMSTIWMIPNSMSCCIVRGGTDVDRGQQPGFALRRHPARVDDPKQRSAGRNEMADPPVEGDLHAERFGAFEQKRHVDKADISRFATDDDAFLSLTGRRRLLGTVRRFRADWA